MKKIISATLLLTCIFICASFKTNAQAITNEELKAQLVKDWIRAKDYTDAYLSTMPGDKYFFKAVDSIRSFAQKMLPLATENIFFMASLTGKPPVFGQRNL